MPMSGKPILRFTINVAVYAIVAALLSRPLYADGVTVAPADPLTSLGVNGSLAGALIFTIHHLVALTRRVADEAAVARKEFIDLVKDLAHQRSN